MRIRIAKSVRAVLLDQLVAAGLAATTPAGTSILEIDPDEAGGWATVPDAQAAAAQAAIAAHDAATLDTQAQAARQQFLDDKALLKAFQQNNTPTQAQAVAAIKAQSRMLRLLALAD